MARFAADEMLGKLAKWLRVVGCDVAYSNRIEDRDLIGLCLREGRVLLTRDTRLVAELRGVPHLLIESDHYREQLKQVLLAFEIDPYEAAFSRCILCNAELEEVVKEGVKSQVPPHVFKTQAEFYRCPGCGKLYWPGTHRDRMEEMLQGLAGPG